MTPLKNEIVNIAAYKFATLDKLKQRRVDLTQLGMKLDLKGTVLLSREGINIFIAGTKESVREFIDFVKHDELLSDLELKESYSDRKPFTRFLVRIKKEIIAFGIPGIDPRQHTSKRITAEALKSWLDSGKPVTLLDVRNDYEIEIGTFSKAVPISLTHFRHFPEAVEKLPAAMKDQPVVTFCTGGIRCEKAAPLLEQSGFKDVYQLEGGILKYFEKVGGDHYDGDCFVFDQRVALDPALQETDIKQCYLCQQPLSLEVQQDPRYVEGISCPFCYTSPERSKQETLVDREHAIRLAADPLPGSIPYTNRRPVHVPGRYDRWKLIDFLVDCHPHVELGEWQEWFGASQILKEGSPVQPDTLIRSGERYERVIPNTVEPDVNPDIRLLYEDDGIVAVMKPAPLPAHPCGRFNLNTLVSIMNRVYAPQKLKPAHRLDANTAGVMVLSRKARVASRLQPQFEHGTVFKEYLTRVQGIPEHAEFESRTPLSRETSITGIRLPDSDGNQAHTSFRILRRLQDGTSLLTVQLHTGRTNQIRVHLWELGLPICGDPIFLPNQELGARQTLELDEKPLCLLARKLEFSHPTTGLRMVIEAPDPEWAEAL